MNQRRPIGVALVIIGALIIVTALGAGSARKPELVIGIGVILVGLVQASQARLPK